MTVRILNSGFLTTVQDLGRFGRAHLGVSPAGAADQLSFRIANRLVGNREGAPALEMTLVGASLKFEEAAVIAISGALCEVYIGDKACPLREALAVPAGATVACGNMARGARAYLAVRGGFDVPLVMGSASTHLNAGFGGHEGRRLRACVLLRVGKQEAADLAQLRPGAWDGLHHDGPIRLTRGAEQQWFGEESFERLFSGSYVVSEHSDRTGLRLQGEPLPPRQAGQLLTGGVPLGALQVPPDRQPIILFVDQQTTGGYPKIANVISADMHRIGQLRPRDVLRFEEVSLSEALLALRQQEEWFSSAFE